jgi:hypothetical protein
MKKLLLTLLLTTSAFAQDNPYDVINKRNAFDLIGESAIPTLPPITDIVKPQDIFLTGITRLKGVKQIHLVLKRRGEPDRFVSLTVNEEQHEVKLNKILQGSALVSNYGEEQLISFKNNGLPTIITKSPSSSKATIIKKDKKEDKRKQSSAPPKPQASIVKVPSRRPKIDPKIIEKGLEYISRSEDSEKKEYIMKRLESLQSGQYNIKSDIDQNERRRQYDEWKKRREGK